MAAFSSPNPLFQHFVVFFSSASFLSVEGRLPVPYLFHCITYGGCPSHSFLYSCTNIESPGLWTGSGVFNNRGWQSTGNVCIHVHVVYKWVVVAGWGMVG